MSEGKKALEEVFNLAFDMGHHRYKSIARQYVADLEAERDKLRNALPKLSQMNTDAIGAIQWLRGEILSLCEATEDLEGDDQFTAARRYEAKGIRRAIAECIRERLDKMSDHEEEIQALKDTQP